ncbi:MAG: Rrf2 family transcriptional regulator [Rhodospirillales bacterium]|nr:Rrf2 family transcriptional regulator [Rhodospirillales bacterium]
MRLTQFSNFAIRILMYAALRGDPPSGVPEIARAYGISYDHLKKAAGELSRRGYLETVRGRNGGVRLAMPPEAIRIGDVIRHTEGEMTLVECFDPLTSTCPLRPECKLRHALGEALAAFFAVLDGYTLADLVQSPERLAPLLGMPAGEALPQPTSPAHQSGETAAERTRSVGA